MSEPERHGHGGDRRRARAGRRRRPGQLRVPGGVGLVEGVAVDAAVERVGEERPQVQQHDRAGQHPQQRQRPHAHRPAEQLVERRGRAASRVDRASPCASRTRLAGRDPGRVGVVPGRDRGLEVARLAVARRVAGDPVERGVEERELVVEPGVGVVADRGVAEPAVRHELVPAVARPRLARRDAPAVGGDPHHVGPPGARLREHLERELLVVGPVAPRHEAELQDDDGDDHHPPPDDPDPRLHAAGYRARASVRCVSSCSARTESSGRG